MQVLLLWVVIVLGSTLSGAVLFLYFDNKKRSEKQHKENRETIDQLFNRLAQKELEFSQERLRRIEKYSNQVERAIRIEESLSNAIANFTNMMKGQQDFLGDQRKFFTEFITAQTGIIKETIVAAIKTHP